MGRYFGGDVERGGSFFEVIVFEESVDQMVGASLFFLILCFHSNLLYVSLNGIKITSPSEQHLTPALSLLLLQHLAFPPETIPHAELVDLIQSPLHAVEKLEALLLTDFLVSNSRQHSVIVFLELLNIFIWVDMFLVGF